MIPLLNGGPTGRHRVVCAEHKLDRTVDTEAHASNLLALHLRRDHPGTSPAEPTVLDVAAAAAFVAIMQADYLMPEPSRDATLRVWRLLTGLNDDDALAYAREVAATDQRAALIPF